MKPLFLLSLPRSGSTLLQRILAQNSQVATHAEPWVMLPPLFALRFSGARSMYNHQVASTAIKEFVAHGSGGMDAYYGAVRSYAMRLYAQHIRGERYFLDKTPRYSLIAEELTEVFPEAKFIFLWRHPLAVISSISRTWWNGRWRLASYQGDLYEGLANLVRVYSSNPRRFVALRYEDLVDDPERNLRVLSDYLDLEVAVPEDVGHRDFAGTLGDPSPNRVQANLERRSSVDSAVSSILRRRAMTKYVEWIGEARLRVMGYDLGSILKEVEDSRGRHGTLVQDLFDFPNDLLRIRLKQRILHTRANIMHR